MRHPYDHLGRIATPRDGMADCATPERYANQHAHQMAAKRRAFPTLDFQMPWVSTATPVPFVLGGKWIVVCDCGDAPMASPEWDQARCFNCGAIYRGLTWPQNRQELEELLTDRPSAQVRAWLPAETADDLRAQNDAHGITSKARTR